MTGERRRRTRDRHGRGMRGRLAPRHVPLSRSPGETFDDTVLDAVEDLEQTWAAELDGIEFAVEDVPPLPPGGTAALDFDPEVVSDGGVPLGRLYRTGLDGVKGPVIVVYRRPVEARAIDPAERAELVFSVVVELVAELLGRDVEDLEQ